MRISCDSCEEVFQTEDEDWRAFINEAKGEGWIMVNKNGDWYRYCSEECKKEAE